MSMVPGVNWEIVLRSYGLDSSEAASDIYIRTRRGPFKIPWKLVRIERLEGNEL
jgi:hypothetical protein